MKNAQEAHEAIRPAGHPFELPDTLRSELNADEFQLFDMIWKRTIASQMADARGRRIIDHDRRRRRVFQVSGKTIDFPGYLRAYVEGSRRSAGGTRRSGNRAAERRQSAKRSQCGELDAEGAHDAAAGPVQRSVADRRRSKSAASAGRVRTPRSSTRSQSRDYVFKKGNALVPTWVAFSVVQAAGRASADAGRLPVHRADGRRPRRDQPRRAGVRRLSRNRSTSATARRA